MKPREQLFGFLIRRLIAVLIFIAVSQSLISFLFTTVFYPFIKTQFHIDLLSIVHMTSSSPVTIGKSLLWFIGYAMMNLLPEVVRIPLRIFLGRASAREGWGGYLSQIPARNRIGTMVILALLLLVELAIYLFPYILATIMYSKWVIQKVDELRKQDAMEREEAEKQRNLLLSDIAHDLKTPITTISGYANALQDHVVEGEKMQEEYLTTIATKSIQMSQLINLLFQYVTLDSEGFKLDCKKRDILELVTETVAVNYSDIEAAGFELEMDIPQIPIMASVDEIQMSRAITNLIQNAIRHNPANTVIMISIKNLYDRVSIDVADSGVAIEETIRGHLFDPFVMGDDSRSHRGGSGLGLSISAKIIELHGGNISLKQPYQWREDEVAYTKAFHMEIPLYEDNTSAQHR